MVFNCHCSEKSNPYINFPQSEFMMRQKRKTNKYDPPPPLSSYMSTQLILPVSFRNMITSFIANSQPEIRGSLNTTFVVMELVPHLVDIISPKIRQVTTIVLPLPVQTNTDGS